MLVHLKNGQSDTDELLNQDDFSINSNHLTLKQLNPKFLVILCTKKCEHLAQQPAIYQHFAAKV
jgi:hypothetical protein